jgi:hypothetical protein
MVKKVEKEEKKIKQYVVDSIRHYSFGVNGVVEEREFFRFYVYATDIEGGVDRAFQKLGLKWCEIGEKLINRDGVRYIFFYRIKESKVICLHDRNLNHIDVYVSPRKDPLKTSRFLVTKQRWLKQP